MGKFELPTLQYTLESIWRQKKSNAPFILANLILIGLACYRLIRGGELSKDESMKISYADITFSFIGSFIVLLWSGICVFGLIFGTSGLSIVYRVLYILVFLAIFLVLNPFSVTVLRVGLNDKLSEQQKNIMAGLIIPLVLFSSYLTANITNGYFFDI